MAGGKLTPRQKMINLMYLVFIAMLALNMSKEVLTAFGILDNKIVESNKISDDRNKLAFQQLVQKAADQPGQFGDKKDKIEKIRVVSKEFSDYIESIKTTITKEFPRDKDGNYPCEQMDKSDAMDNLFYKGDKESAKAKEFLDKIRNYASQIKQIGGITITEKEVKKIEKRFATDEVYSEKAGAKLSWLDYNYHHFPLIASVTKLSQIQADIKTTESDVMNSMFQTNLIEAASLKKNKAMVIFDKSVYFQGEAVTGKVVLGKYDDELKIASVSVNGSGAKVSSGQAEFSIGSGNVGEHTLTGSFNFIENGKVEGLEIDDKYVVVARPKSATISADKMNVVYRGVENPMTISFAGISGDNVKANAAGLRNVGGGSSYIMSPGQGTEVTINVSGVLPDKSVVSDKKVFRIKNIPAPVGAIGGEQGLVKGSKSRLQASQITAVLNDFDFQVNISVVQFSLKVTGQPTVVVNGNRVNAQCAAALNRATRGDQVTISEIKTRLEGSQIILRQTAPVIYEIL